MAGFSGHTAIVRVNGANLEAHRYSVDWKIQDFDVTSFTNVNFGEYTSGLADVDISFDAFYDSTDNPFGAPISLIPGTIVSIVITLDTSGVHSTGTWNFPKTLLTSVRQESGVRDTVHYSVTGKTTVKTTGQIPVMPTS